MDTPTYTTDTSPDALHVQLECLRKMSPQDRMRKTCALSDQVRRMALAAIRRRQPDLNEADVQLRFIELVYGKDLAVAVANWKAEQAG